jgi:glutathione-specific gamma-glutamylcyclotransferase
MADMDEFWVFGYGSLMWRPGFEHLGGQRARLFGFHRSLCLESRVHRGTSERSGLVLALDRGGSCIGIAYQVDIAKRDTVIAYLRGRELVTSAYLEREVLIKLDGGQKVRAITYVMDRAHEQYAGALRVGDAARRVIGAVGISGTNEDYVKNAVNHLKKMGIRDRWLEAVVNLIAIK